ncbi:GDYXXLXY domain-containing protein [Nocardioides currus]|uniref:GDYXXLXY domain-containing protein n=1 Tax=Nocardioides currus TaxID=2133958 RepID=A0A2R7YYY6_9ACTN|nr:GDYXXLXY domain-containing protein [Nocardioides currus]PUA81598.1 hypothetical protein C7S10_05860 [Nocardioides currus]
MNKLVTLATVVAVQAGLVGVAVAPQLSARLTGEAYALRVAPLDPIDPFRGAYVTLDYPDLQLEDQLEGRPMFITLVERDGVMVADDYTLQRPDQQPYLACDSTGWRVDCGIDSLFLPQDEAAAMEETLRDGAIAEVRIDGRGHAALIGVRAP